MTTSRALHLLPVLTLALTAATARAAPSATQPACPYPTAHDAPLEPTIKPVDTAADYTLHRVEFNGVRPGSRVPANLYLPTRPAFKVPYPAILLQYGSGGNKNTNYIVAIARIAVSRGYVVLTIDAPNRGERRGKDPRLSFFDTNFIQYLGDYSRATDYLCSRPDVDRSRLAYIGISWGAITGITYCAHDPRIAVVASLVGGGNFAALVPGGVGEAVQKTLQTYDPFYHVKYIGNRPLLLLNVTRDQLVPRVLSDALHEAAPPGASKVWLECDHFFNGVDRTTTCGSVIDFVTEKLATIHPKEGHKAEAISPRGAGKS